MYISRAGNVADGRLTMQTKAKSNSTITHKVDGNVITFQARGKSIEPDKPGAIVGETSLDLTKAHENLRKRAEIHGWIQRISDAAALPFDKDTKRFASPEEKLAAMDRLVQHYMTGTQDWSPVKSRAIGTDEVLAARVLQEVHTDKTPERIREFVAGLRAAERTAILAKYKEVADRLRGEMSQDVDADALLAGL
jgi:hypothetical protein